MCCYCSLKLSVWLSAITIQLQSVVLVYQLTDRIKQRLPHVLSISVLQARPTELTLNPSAVLAAAARLGVNGFLPALMTRGALSIRKTPSTTGWSTVNTDAFIHWRTSVKMLSGAEEEDVTTSF